jgi:glycosyltransferase involved in cell wall biosynthesis
VLTGRNFIILSTQDWDAMPTRKHRWARNWAREGNRVLYVEQQMHWAGWLAALRTEFLRPLKWLAGPRLVEPHLWVFTLPIVLPFFQMNTAINWLNNLWLAPVLRWALRRVDMRSPVLWTYTPHSDNLIGPLGQTFTVYECVDEFSASKGLVHGPTIAALERNVLEKADLVIVTAQGLFESKKAFAKRIEVVPNGVDVDHFAKASQPGTPVAEVIARLPKPVVGYLGAVQYWVDFDLVSHAARAHPEWSFVFVGSVEPLARVDKVRNLPNVYFLGRQPYADLPEYVAGFDVCINPYILDGVAENVDPLKLYDYIASGKPVVSVDIPAARRFAGVIALTKTPEDFVQAIAAAIATPGDAATRQQAASAHSWQARFSKIQEILGPLLPA